MRTYAGVYPVASVAASWRTPHAVRVFEMLLDECPKMLPREMPAKNDAQYCVLIWVSPESENILPRSADP